MSRKPREGGTSFDLTAWRNSGREFEDLLDQNFANLSPGLCAKHGRGMLLVRLADDNSWARTGSYLRPDDLDDAIESQHTALELIRLYDPKAQAVLGYCDEAGELLDTKIITIRNAELQKRDATVPATRGTVPRPAKPATTTTTPVTASSTVKGRVDRPPSTSPPMIECARVEDCQQRIEKTKASARWIAVVVGGTAAIRGHDAGHLIDRALWFCSWSCLRDFALALTEQQAAAHR